MSRSWLLRLEAVTVRWSVCGDWADCAIIEGGDEDDGGAKAAEFELR